MERPLAISDQVLSEICSEILFGILFPIRSTILGRVLSVTSFKYLGHCFYNLIRNFNNVFVICKTFFVVNSFENSYVKMSQGILQAFFCVISWELSLGIPLSNFYAKSSKKRIFPVISRDFFR